MSIYRSIEHKIKHLKVIFHNYKRQRIVIYTTNGIINRYNDTDWMDWTN